VASGVRIDSLTNSSKWLPEITSNAVSLRTLRSVFETCNTVFISQPGHEFRSLVGLVRTTITIHSGFSPAIRAEFWRPTRAGGYISKLIWGDHTDLLEPHEVTGPRRRWRMDRFPVNAGSDAGTRLSTHRGSRRGAGCREARTGCPSRTTHCVRLASRADSNRCRGNGARKSARR